MNWGPSAELEGAESNDSAQIFRRKVVDGLVACQDTAWLPKTSAQSHDRANVHMSLQEWSAQSSCRRIVAVSGSEDYVPASF